MNTPLAAARTAIKELDFLIKEYSQSIDNKNVSPEDHKNISKDMNKYMNIALQSLEESAKFIKGIKAQTYNMSNKNMQTFSADKVLLDTINLLEYLFITNNCKLTKEIENEITLFGHPRSFSQISTNLVINAIDACVLNSDKKLITIILKKIDEKKVILAVQDNGAGISKENLVKIFDPFFTTKPFGEGTGLGLSIVHELVNEFDGKIEVESKPGKTIFTVTFSL
jgi:signal transduction histidine kinase